MEHCFGVWQQPDNAEYGQIKRPFSKRCSSKSEESTILISTE
jgi:hypothetical protein